MSSDGGITEQVFGLDLLAEHKMKPWWEVIHGYLLAATITSSGLIVYFTSSAQQVDCLPISENASRFTESQINLMNGYCTGEIPWYATFAGIINFVEASLILVASNIWLKHPNVIDAFRTFMKAANIIHGLHSRSEKLNQKATTPVFAEHGEAFELRKACLLLWTHPNKIQWQYSFRNYLVIFITTLAFAGTFTISILMIGLVVSPHFNCTLSEDLKEEVYVVLNGHYDYFLCSYNHAKLTFPFVLLCGGAFLGQICALAFACIKLRPISLTLSDTKVFSDAFLEARAYVHFMEIFWTNANPIDSQRFKGLLRYIFSKEAVTSMIRFIPMAISNMDTIKEENDFPGHQGRKYRYRAVRNPDLTYIEMYVHICRNGGNDIISKLYKIFESRNFSKPYLDIKEALRKVEFTRWDDDATNFLKAAGEAKHWDLLVSILNSFKDSHPESPHPRKIKCGFYDFDTEDREEGKENGRNVLYYALHKEEGDTNFRSVAIKHILGCLMGKGKLPVHDESSTVTAKDFVMTQYDHDPTFSEDLKVKLLSIIKFSEDSNFKFATVKV